MTCCGASACESQFDRKRAARELKNYRAHGPAHPTTRAMIHLLRRAGVEGTTLLDIGGDIGAIQHDLLEAGAREVTAVDASSAYQQAARVEAERRGVSARIQFRLGDFVTLAPEVAVADIVTLDRVVCCYPDMEPLVRLSAERCRRRIACRIRATGGRCVRWSVLKTHSAGWFAIHSVRSCILQW